MSFPLHPLHCETCKNMDCIRHGIHNLYPKECDLVTEAVGCASHSDTVRDVMGGGGRISKSAVAGAPPLAVHDNIIKREERNKVLDEVLEDIWDDPPSDNGAESMDRICGIIERIRQQTGEL